MTDSSETPEFFSQSFFADWLKWIRTNAHDDAAAAELAAWFASEERMMHDMLVRHQRMQKQSASVNVLDVGCGFGNHIIEVLELHPGWRATGIDSNYAATLTARRRAVERGLGDRAAFITGDASFLGDQLDSEFDCVICLNTLGIFPERVQGQILRSLRHVLRPGGWLVVSAYSEEATTSRIASYEAVGLVVHVEGAHIVATAGLRSEAFSPKRLRTLISRYGFVPIGDVKAVGNIGLVAVFERPIV